jgi:recombination protein RecT
MPNEIITHKQTAMSLIAGMESRIKEMLPQHMTPERMLRVLNNAVSRNPKLLKCTQTSFCSAVTSASEFGLEPNTPLGLCHIIPYKDQATFQMGYPGLVELAYRSGQVKSICAEVVRANDVFKCTKGLERKLVHEPNWEDPGDPIGYYAVIHIEGTDPQWDYMPRAEVEAHAKRFSKSFSRSDSAWQTNFDSMAKKTVLIRALKFAPKSIENRLFQKALYSDTDNILNQADTEPAIDVPSEPVDALEGLTEDLTEDIAPNDGPCPECDGQGKPDGCEVCGMVSS